MKIIHVYKTYYPDTLGGAEKAIEQICKATSLYGCENQLLTVSKNARFCPSKSFENVQAHYYQSSLDVASCPMSWEMLLKAKQQIKKADIIHYHFPWPFADLLHILLNIKKPSIVTYHSDIVRQAVLKYAYRPVRNMFLKRVDCIVPTSKNLLNSSHALNQYRSKSYPIPLGLSAEKYQLANTQLLEEIKSKYGNQFFLFVGVLRYYKGLHLLIEAVRNTNIPVVIAGDGTEKRALMDLVSKYNLQNTVYFPGKISDQEKIAFLQCARAVVLPSHLRSEAFGVILLEGLLFGKPLISTELGTGTSFVNQDGVTGFVVKPNDVSQLRDAIMRINDDDRLVKKFSVNARQHFEKYFNLPSIGQQYVELYRKIKR